MSKINPNFVLLAFILALLIAATVLPIVVHSKTPSTEEIRFLINEMTTTPQRKQEALDKLAGYDDDMLIRLFPYFSDERPIAGKEVRFLNTNPRAIEKYYMTTATKVNEVVIQFFCWRTARCAPSSEMNDMEKIKRELETDLKTCKSRDSKSNSLCRDKLGIRP